MKEYMSEQIYIIINSSGATNRKRLSHSFPKDLTLLIVEYTNNHLVTVTEAQLNEMFHYYMFEIIFGKVIYDCDLYFDVIHHHNYNQICNNTNKGLICNNTNKGLTCEIYCKYMDKLLDTSLGSECNIDIKLVELLQFKNQGNYNIFSSLGREQIRSKHRAVGENKNDVLSYYVLFQLIDRKIKISKYNVFTYRLSFKYEYDRKKSIPLIEVYLHSDLSLPSELIKYRREMI